MSNLERELWNEDREALHVQLSDIDSDLAGLYRQTIRVLDSPSAPEDHKARLTLVSHCVRELMNNLPDSLSDTEGFPASMRGEEDAAREALILAVEELHEPLQDRPLDDESRSSQPERVTVSGELLDAALACARVYRNGQARAQHRDAAAVLGRIDPTDPALKPWRRARRFFMSFAHLDRLEASASASRRLPSDDEVITQLQVVEASIRVRVGAFFESLNEVRELVERANYNTPDGFQPPSASEVDAALARLGSVHLRRAFYAQLQNPHWIAALAQQGAFASPPATEVMPDGMVRSDPWPEIDYLARMAPVVGDVVASVLVSLASSTNQWVRRGIVESAVQMAPEDAAQLIPAISQWPGDESANFRVDPSQLTRLVVNLLESPKRRDGRKLANAFYGPRAPASVPEFGLPEPIAGLDSYWYSDGLPAVARALGPDRVPALAGWLRDYQQDSGSYQGERHHDMSYIWRPSVRASAEYHAREIGNSLVDELRLALIAETSNNPNSLARLLNDDQPLVRRIALDVLSESLAEAAGENPADSERPDSHVADLLSQAQAVLGDESFTESDFAAEYPDFIHACKAWQAQLDMSPLHELIRLGPPVLRDGRREMLEAGETPDEGMAASERYLKHWQHRMLHLLGAKQLPRDLRARLAALEVEFGALDEQQQSLPESGWVGPTSPLDIDELSELTDDELLEHLGSWHPDPSTWPGPTHEGQARVLAEALSVQPGRLSDRVRDLQTLRPTYVRSIMRAWAKSMTEGHPLDWEAVIPLCQWAAPLDDEVALETDGDSFDDDPDYRNLKFAVLQLLDAGLASRTAVDVGVPVRCADAAQGVLAALACHSEPTSAYEAEHGGDNMDPLTISINKIRPEAIRALTRLVERFPGIPAASEALGVLELHLPQEDPSLAVSASIGEATARLLVGAPSWLEKHAECIYGSEAPTTPQQQVAVSTALATHHYHPDLVELLRRPMLEMIRELPDVQHQTGWRTHTRTFGQLLGDWVMRGVVGGDLAHDDPLVEAWFTYAPVDLRGTVLGHLAWLMTRQSTVPDKVVQRVGALWDWRIDHVKTCAAAAELQGIYWFASAEQFPVEWWLPRLEYASSVVPGFATRGMVGEKLATASTGHPRMALQTLDNILGDHDSPGQRMEYGLIEHAAPQVLASALDWGDADLVSRASRLMNHLGAQGYIWLQDRVEELRSGHPD